jgi:type I restriction enzyme M protein
MNMLLHGLLTHRIEKGDTMRDPKLLEDGGLMLFDRVIANPPFSLDEWGHEVAEHDAYGRFRFGIPPKGKGDLAFVQHMVATLARRAARRSSCPTACSSAGRARGTIRKGMLEEDLVEAVVGLPSNLFYGTGIPAAVLVLNGQADRAEGKVLFIEASREFKQGTNQNFLRARTSRRSHHVPRLTATSRSTPRRALEEIEKNEFNLNISRYVETAEAQEKVDVARRPAEAPGGLRERGTRRRPSWTPTFEGARVWRELPDPVGVEPGLRRGSPRHPPVGNRAHVRRGAETRPSSR